MQQAQLRISAKDTVLSKGLYAGLKMTKSTTQSLKSAFNASALVVHCSFVTSRQVSPECKNHIESCIDYQHATSTYGQQTDTAIFATQYETNSDDVRRQFEEHGDIKTFFDLISTRGMVFVTYVS